MYVYRHMLNREKLFLCVHTPQLPGYGRELFMSTFIKSSRMYQLYWRMDCPFKKKSHRYRPGSFPVWLLFHFLFFSCMGSHGPLLSLFPSYIAILINPSFKVCRCCSNPQQHTHARIPGQIHTCTCKHRGKTPNLVHVYTHLHAWKNTHTHTPREGH